MILPDGLQFAFDRNFVPRPVPFEFYECNKWFPVQETISADKDYVPAMGGQEFVGRHMIIYCSKPVVLELNGDPTTSRTMSANIGLQLTDFRITAVNLKSVPVGTVVDMTITG